MADNYLLVKGENGYTVKVKLKDLKDGTFALASNVATSALPTGAATELTLDEIRSYIYSMLQQIATEDKQDALAALIGALTATAETDPTESASLIALLKGILKQLQGDGEKPNVTQLTGSNMELYGATINDRPDADTVAAGTTFTIVDENLDQNWISDGTNWKEV